MTKHKDSCNFEVDLMILFFIKEEEDEHDEDEDEEDEYS